MDSALPQSDSGSSPQAPKLAPPSDSSSGSLGSRPDDSGSASTDSLQCNILDILDELEELHSVKFGLAVVLAHFVERSLEEVAGADAGDFDRVLEAEEHPFAGAFFGGHVEKILAVEVNRAFGDFIDFAAGEDLAEGALARTILAHDGVNCAGVDGEVDPLEDLAAAAGDFRVEIFDFEQWH